MRGMIVILFFGFTLFYVFFTGTASADEPIRAVYINSGRAGDPAKVSRVFELIRYTEVNAVVIDIKDSAILLEESHKRLIGKFREKNIYTICRVVVFQDARYAIRNPDSAIKKRNGRFWWSGRESWRRYWIDPADKSFWKYNRDIVLDGIQAGCQEINFDYIRYPSDGDMKDMVYPSTYGKAPTVGEKRRTLRKFFAYLRDEIKSKYPMVVLSIDIFGYAFMNGKEEGIGQYLEDAAGFFDVVAPMAYPSHYRCGEFGVKDPNTAPYKVYKETLSGGFRVLNAKGKSMKVRPWLQGFSVENIYKCGPVVDYSRRDRFREQIRALKELGIEDWMVWEPPATYPHELFIRK